MKTTFITMLRGINVSGQKKIRMAELKEAYESLGLVHCQTYVQSGNVVCDAAKQIAEQLAASIESQIEQSFGFTVPVFVRDAADFRRIVDGNPFANERDEDPAKLHVTFLGGRPSKAALHNLDIPQGIADELAVGDREIYLFCPHGYGRTKLSNNFFERRLNVACTTRNWKTVKTLHEMAHPS